MFKIQTANKKTHFKKDQKSADGCSLLLEESKCRKKSAESNKTTFNKKKYKRVGSTESKYSDNVLSVNDVIEDHFKDINKNQMNY